MSGPFGESTEGKIPGTGWSNDDTVDPGPSVSPVGPKPLGTFRVHPRWDPVVGESLAVHKID